MGSRPIPAGRRGERAPTVLGAEAFAAFPWKREPGLSVAPGIVAARGPEGLWDVYFHDEAEVDVWVQGLASQAAAEAVAVALAWHAAHVVREKPPQWISTEEAAAVLGVHTNTIRRLIREGKLRSIQVGRLYRVDGRGLGL